MKICNFGYEIPYEMIAGTSIENFCWYTDFEYLCKELGLCKEDGDITNQLCKVPDTDYCNSTDELVKECAGDLRKCLASNPDFKFCDTFSEFCFPMPEEFSTDMIPTIPADMKIEYGDPFFTRGGSVNFALENNVTLITCEFEIVEPISIAEKILATQMSKRELPLFPGS